MALVSAPFVSSSAFIAPQNRFRLRLPLPPLLNANIRPNTRRHNLNPLTSAYEANVTIDNENNQKKSRLVKAAETTIQWTIQYIFLQRYASFAVDINAESNLAFLRGEFSIFVSGRECVSRFKALSFQRLDITGKNLHLGRFPLFVLCLPRIIWRLRKFIWSALLTTQLLVITGYLKSQSLQRVIRTIKDQVYKTINARKSTINYSMSIVKDDVTRSFLLRYWFQSILKSLAGNSVVGAAAAVGDAFKKNWKAYQNESLRLSPSQSADSALVPSTTNKSHSGSQSTHNQISTSNLLSATTFKLKDVSFSKRWVVLQAEAFVPNDSSPDNKKMLLPFTVRTQIRPTNLTPDTQSKKQQTVNNAIGFLNPECRMNTNPLTAGTLLGKLIPDIVWIPFGLGVVLPLGEGCQIDRAEVIDGYDGIGVFQIDGSFNIL